MISRLLYDKIFLIIMGAIILATLVKIWGGHILLIYAALFVVMIGLSKYALDLLNVWKLQLR